MILKKDGKIVVNNGKILTNDGELNPSVATKVQEALSNSLDNKDAIEKIISGEIPIGSIISFSVDGEEIETDMNGNIDLPLSKYKGGSKINYSSETGKLSLLDKEDNVISEVNLPLESFVTSGQYNAVTNEIELYLTSGKVVKIPISDLVSMYRADEENITLIGKTFHLSNRFLSDVNNKANKSDLNKYSLKSDTVSKNELNTKQNILSSGENIKTINGYSILGPGNLNFDDLDLVTESSTISHNFESIEGGWYRLVKFSAPSVNTTGQFVANYYENEKLISTVIFNFSVGVDKNGKIFSEICPLIRVPNKIGTNILSSTSADYGVLSVRIENSDEGLFLVGLLSGSSYGVENIRFDFSITKSSNVYFLEEIEAIEFQSDIGYIALTKDTDLSEPTKYKIQMSYFDYDKVANINKDEIPENCRNITKDLIILKGNTMTDGGFSGFLLIWGTFDYDINTNEYAIVRWLSNVNELKFDGFPISTNLMSIDGEIIRGTWAGETSLFGLIKRNCIWLTQEDEFIGEIDFEQICGTLTLTNTTPGLIIFEKNGVRILEVKKGETASISILLNKENDYKIINTTASEVQMKFVMDENEANKTIISIEIENKIPPSLNEEQKEWEILSYIAIAKSTVETRDQDFIFDTSLSATYTYGSNAETQTYDLYDLNYKIEELENKTQHIGKNIEDYGIEEYVEIKSKEGNAEVTEEIIPVSRGIVGPPGSDSIFVTRYTADVYLTEDDSNKYIKLKKRSSNEETGSIHSFNLNIPDGVKNCKILFYNLASNGSVNIIKINSVSPDVIIDYIYPVINETNQFELYEWEYSLMDQPFSGGDVSFSSYTGGLLNLIIVEIDDVGIVKVHPQLAIEE